MSKIRRGKIGESKVNKTLRKIPGCFDVLADITLINEASGLSHQIDHVLLHPHGVFVIETKNYAGVVSVEDDGQRWRKSLRGKVIPIASPLRQNKSHVKAVGKLLRGIAKPVGVVVFASNNAPYLPDENVINLEDLPLFVESYPYEKELSQASLEKIRALLLHAKQEIDVKEHIENIAIVRQVRKETQAEMAYAIETGHCPRCEGEIQSNEEYEYHCPRCGYRFKL